MNEYVSERQTVSQTVCNYSGFYWILVGLANLPNFANMPNIHIKHHKALNMPSDKLGFIKMK